ncbi:UDP-3-O-[3-hydroxymyristoyl] glucosamine N-acyltransferase [Moraxella macacae 0408225]|uniref:UDP-3-O-acylglucosamine N-acyltransferase n=1 Tax=Moraxella macacae 0408225 TaxID=1230338 RepID=L2F5K2_9GAMM|nr:UDP-3-O-(3-hydroxymyristoyl)glucosamine N-acyltransferase [Moraxella macacae]ELA08307.1 UDP-3-O-[3-hydroxymyristoyl] glucosamine N-acyltransferase [Moraxella macacae 0408225]
MTQLTLTALIDHLADDPQTVVKNTDVVLNFVANKPNFCLRGIAPLQDANADELAFLANPKYQAQLDKTNAGAVLLPQDLQSICPNATLAIVVANPYLAFAKLTQFFAYWPNVDKPFVIHPTASIAKTATIGRNVTIGAFCVIGEHAIIGDNCTLDSHVVVADFACLGQHCQLKSHSFVAYQCQLGDFVVLHSHASIGNDGFGYAPKGDTALVGWQKIHQLGRVVIGDHVRIGSQTCVDRGALGDTVIGNHVMIDNLVQIAHNVKIGDGTVIAGCVGIAGSSKIGKRCVLAGGVGLVGHIEICDDVTITGMTMVTKSIKTPGSYSSGTPMLPTAIWKKMAIKIKQLVKN